jgi:hypothetical protein
MAASSQFVAKSNLILTYRILSGKIYASFYRDESIHLCFASTAFSAIDEPLSIIMKFDKEFKGVLEINFRFHISKFESQDIN